MAEVENLKIGNTSYEIRDKHTVRLVDSLPATADEGTIVHNSSDNKFYKYMTHYLPYVSANTPVGKQFVFTCTDPVTFAKAFVNLSGGTIEDLGETYWRLTKTDFGETWDLSVDMGAGSPKQRYFLSRIGCSVTGPTPETGDVITGTLYGPNTQEGDEVTEWVEINVQEVTQVINSLASTSQWYALSAAQGKILKDAIDNISAVGRMLALWDAVAGEARYMPSGVSTYQQGDYFIVSAIAGEGGVNYRPDGSSYAPSTTPETEDLMISDMYFYNGEEWLLLPNSAKQIAVDDTLSTASQNPVENRVITGEINTIKEDVVALETAVTGKQDTLVSGENIKTINGEDVLGEGDIVIKAGGAGVPCVVDVNSKQIGKFTKNRFGNEYLGDFTYMQFTTNLDKEQLVEKMNDLYVTISRRKRQTQRDKEAEFHPGSIAKMVVQNDHRFKLDKKLYCWRYTEPGTDEADPRRYYYYYTEEKYNNTVADLFEADPSIYMYTGYDFSSSKATCLNILDKDTNDWHITDAGGEMDISRYEAGDVDTFVPKNTKAFDYKTYVTKMHCKEAIKDSERYFLWCADWEDTTTNAVYGTGVAEDIPEHFEGIETVTVSEYELGNNRPELAYYQFDTTKDMYDFVEGLYHSTMGTDTYPLEEGHYNWNCYPFDYPIIPTRLADCEILVSMPGAGDGSIDRKGDWIKLKEAKDMPFFADLKQVVFRHPMNTSELWMRFSSWQKRCMYQSLNDELGYSSDVKNCWIYAVDADITGGEPNYAFSKRSFARQRGGFRSYGNNHSKISEYIEFNLATGDDIAHGLMSKSTPVRKRLVSTSHGARSWLSD